MSASERLRELERVSRDLRFAAYRKDEAELLVLNALPEIAAVVEAAERFTEAVDYSIANGLEPSLAFATAERVRLDEELRPTLAALEEELSG